MTLLSNHPSNCLKSLTNEELMVYNFRAYVSPLLALIGIPANIFVIIIFNILERHESCRFNLYAIWMALAHLIQLTVNTLIDDFLGRGLRWATDCHIWYQVDAYSSFTCKLFTYLSDVSALIASFILMLFSVDRVFSIYCGKRIEEIIHLSIAKLCIFLIYVICLLLNIPHLIYADLKYDSTEETSCQYIDPVAGGVKYVLYLYIIGVTILPSILIFIMNILILCKLKTTIKHSKLIGYHDKQSHNELSKVITHLAISIMFTCLSLPLVVLMILRQKVHFNNYELIYPIYAYKIIQLSKLFSSVDSFNHTFDFFLYWALLPVFRQTLHKIFLNTCSIILCNYKKNNIGNNCHNNNNNNSNNSMNVIKRSNPNIINNNGNSHRIMKSQMKNISNDNNNQCEYYSLDSPYKLHLNFPVEYSRLPYYRDSRSPQRHYYHHYSNHHFLHHYHHHYRHHHHHPHHHYYQKRQHKPYQLEFSKQLTFHCMEGINNDHLLQDKRQNQKTSKQFHFIDDNEQRN
ncbi:peptide (allatostatin somatostatin)-like receptor [Schistosoma japonicum]|uniref:Peptide (Allatostatin somatostatin)-like receptor n=1 Tax=Schistosoma japonicum TaxID=6182 RepID=A0A4Z2DS99_SCHJA|nr:peptide (allatostatin somatostatin)-like receptor [Schistosoma japonicum]